MGLKKLVYIRAGTTSIFKRQLSLQPGINVRRVVTGCFVN